MFEVYIHEAHPGENMPQYPEFADFEQPTTMEEKIELFKFYRAYIPSKPLVSGDTTIIPALIDSLTMIWENKYSGLATCGFVIGLDGSIKLNTGFLQFETQMDDIEASIEEELANTSIQPVHNSKGVVLNNIMLSNNRIVINGLSNNTTFYSVFKVNGALLQSGNVCAKNSSILLTKECASGVVILKLWGDLNLTKPVILK